MHPVYILTSLADEQSVDASPLPDHVQDGEVDDDEDGATIEVIDDEEEDEEGKEDEYEGEDGFNEEDMVPPEMPGAESESVPEDADEDEVAAASDASEDEVAAALDALTDNVGEGEEEEDGDEPMEGEPSDDPDQATVDGTGAIRSRSSAIEETVTIPDDDEDEAIDDSEVSGVDITADDAPGTPTQDEGTAQSTPLLMPTTIATSYLLNDDDIDRQVLDYDVEGISLHVEDDEQDRMKAAGSSTSEDASTVPEQAGESKPAPATTSSATASSSR